MHPQQITALFNLEPTHQTVRGETFQFSTRSKSHIPRLNMWLLELRRTEHFVPATGLVHHYPPRPPDTRDIHRYVRQLLSKKQRLT